MTSRFYLFIFVTVELQWHEHLWDHGIVLGSSGHLGLI